MRISTQQMFAQGSASISAQYSDMAHTRQQIATGRRILTPSDDPVASAAVLRASTAIAFNQRHAGNQTAALATLNQTEVALGAFGDGVQEARQQLLAANSGSLNDADRRVIATQLANLRDQLLGIANSRDGAGAYLFAGFNESGAPFALTAAGASYAGDDGERQIEVAPQRQLAVSVNGASTFMRVPDGNGVFSVSAAAGNTGDGIVDPGHVVNPAALTGHQYRIAFTAAATYDVIDVTLGSTVSTANAYMSGNAISVAGMQVAISGAPGAGDSFTLDPSKHQNVFATLTQAISALQTPSVNSAGLARTTNQITGALRNLDRALDTALTARTSIGTRQAEIARLQDITSASLIEHQRRLSELQDLDYAVAASDVARQQTMIDANQQTFAKIAKLSLFDYLR